jgi:uncharacterized coiled-coil protein SlyX
MKYIGNYNSDALGLNFNNSERDCCIVPMPQLNQPKEEVWEGKNQLFGLIVTKDHQTLSLKDVKNLDLRKELATPTANYVYIDRLPPFSHNTEIPHSKYQQNILHWLLSGQYDGYEFSSETICKLFDYKREDLAEWWDIIDKQSLLEAELEELEQKVANKKRKLEEIGDKKEQAWIKLNQRENNVKEQSPEYKELADKLADQQKATTSINGEMDALVENLNDTSADKARKATEKMIDNQQITVRIIESLRGKII